MDVRDLSKNVFIIVDHEEPQSSDEDSAACAPGAVCHTQCHTAQTHLVLVSGSQSVNEDIH